VGDIRALSSADRLAAYAGLVPVARDSGKRVGNNKRMRGGNKVLKRVFYQSAFASLEPLRNQKSSFASHNPTLTKNLAFITWHSGGLQAVSLENPAAPAQVGAFYPDPLPSVATEDPRLTSGMDKIAMWSYPIVSNGQIYVVDIRNGLYVLNYTGPFAAEEVAGIGFLEGNSNLGDAARLETGP
jgi:hypothetical protein